MPAQDNRRPVRTMDSVWIPMQDGCRLAATIWLPEDAEQDPVPAILEYLPYRKDDNKAIRDSAIHAYFASYGYGSVRVDMRGTGASDGILTDEYLPLEQDDALQVLRWLENQPWCTGDVGIIGISWGGFNGLQIAARRPRQLKAVITIASTDDRYADDVHYRGGCVLASDMLGWASRMLVLNALPPDPQIVGSRWREMWLHRLENTPPYVETWLIHQTRDDYWKHGSVCEDFAAIECPVYVVGGWSDAYTNAVPRLLEGLPGPRKGLIGPWSHAYPHEAVPGPSIGFLQECLRWWDHWLKGLDTGIMAEPLLRVWMQDSVPPAPSYADRPGRWVAEPEWPPAEQPVQTFWLHRGCLEESPSSGSEIRWQGSQLAGAACGIWCPSGSDVDFPPDQRLEDGLSLSFDSDPVAEAVEVLGVPELTLSVTSDQSNALVVVRLCDVAPDGASLLVSRGFLNLTHRDSHEHPAPLEPGEYYDVTVQLDVLGHRLLAGHRWRLSISATYWPMAWPSPKGVTLAVRAGSDSTLRLPLREPRREDSRLAEFGPPEQAEPVRHERLRPKSRRRTLVQDLASGRQEIRDIVDEGLTKLLDSDLEMYSHNHDTYTIVEADPLSAEVQCNRTMGLQRGTWRVRVETSSTMSADAHHFYVTNLVEAYEDNTRIFAKCTDARMPRNLV